MSVPPERRGWRQNWLARYRRYDLLFRLIFLQLRLGRKIVVALRQAGMGDVIATLPTCRELKRRHPDRVFVYVTHPAFASLLALAGFSPRVVTARTGDLPNLSRFFFTSYRLVCADDANRAPTASFIEDFAASCGVTLPPGSKPTLEPPPALLGKIGAEAAAARSGRPLILLHVGPTAKVKEWPRDKWIALVDLLNQSGCVVAQVGVDSHTQWGSVESTLLPGAHSLLNTLTLAETACWIRQAQLFVGIDSGLVHMAVAVGTPAVLIEGPTDMFHFRPDLPVIPVRAENLPCLGCHHHVPRLHWHTGCPFDILCMRTLDAAAVARAVAASLGGSLPVAS